MTFFQGIAKILTMEDKIQVLILTDGAVSTLNSAKIIASTIEGLFINKYSIVIQQADKFSATELLPAKVFFIGLEAANPASFNYIEDLFKHINFAGRRCGIFSPDKKSFDYLEKILSNTEVSLAEPFLTKDPIDEAEMKNWLKSILDGE